MLHIILPHYSNLKSKNVKHIDTCNAQNRFSVKNIPTLLNKSLSVKYY